jgi:colanic acid/amylovoran biosynthesis glycosyltransferase
MKVVILTNAYPYYPGEQFIDDEISYWAENTQVEVTLLPATAAGKPRPVPKAIAVDMAMTGETRIERLGFIVAAIFSSLFWRELRYLWQARKAGFYTIGRALLHVSKVLLQARRLKRYADTHGDIDIAYGYWNDTPSYAAVLVRSGGSIRKVVARAHGFDLYEARRRRGYMPLKRQFIRAYDALFALSPEGKRYLQATYGACPASIRISPLGVPLAGTLSNRDAAGVHVLSVSFCLPVKRLDRIIEALALFARQHADLAVRWTHIGDGPLREQLQSLAQTRLAELENVAFEFTGEWPNQAVRDYYRTTPVDLFLNASESEAVPVAIMEAMSAGVPAVAPDVGGISTLVSNECGALLRPCPGAQEIADAIDRVALGAGWQARRENARKVIETRFDAARNYRGFISSVLAVDTGSDPTTAFGGAANKGAAT